MFSVIIPTYNNLEYLKLCVKSIKKNSQLDHELIFHINDGSDAIPASNATDKSIKRRAINTSFLTSLS